jgi:hypothetical protein
MQTQTPATTRTTTTPARARTRALLVWCAVATFACVTPGDAVAAELETPTYETLATEGSFSVRRYAPCVLAQTVVDEVDREQASRAGFRRLAGYIFGGNQGRRSIAMTAPVTAEAVPAPPSSPVGERIAMTAPVGAAREGTGWRITFMMPSRYTRATLPVPNDPAVSFVDVPASDRAVVTFSWLTSDERVQEQTAALRAWLRQRGLVEQGSPVLARFDDPFTLPWNRTNEVWIEVGAQSPG